jgi:hypothetical protein
MAQAAPASAKIICFRCRRAIPPSASAPAAGADKRAGCSRCGRGQRAAVALRGDRFGAAPIVGLWLAGAVLVGSILGAVLSLVH